MRISDWSSDVCSSDLAIIPATFVAACKVVFNGDAWTPGGLELISDLRVDEIGGHVEFCSVGGAARPDVTELIGCFQLIIRMAWLWTGEDAKARREDVAVAGQSCIGIIPLQRQKIEIETGFPYDIRLVEEAATEDEVENFEDPFAFVLQDAFLVVWKSLQRKSIDRKSTRLNSSH